MKGIESTETGRSDVAVSRHGQLSRARGRALCGSLSLLVLATVATACRETPVQKLETRHASLGQDNLALIGAEVVTKDAVLQVQATSKVHAEQALASLTQLRLLGGWAHARGLSSGRRDAVERALLARKLLERIGEQARGPDEPRGSEYDDIIRERWVEFERPAAWQVAHVVVRAKGDSDPTAFELAQRIALAVKGATEEAVFLERARVVAKGEKGVVAESLPPVTADGRTLLLDAAGKPVGAQGTFDLDFARAAAKLDSVGDQSGVVRTSFGFHVLLLTRRIDGYVLPVAERKQQLKAEVIRRRASNASREVLSRLHQLDPPQLERAALEWTGRVQVTE